MDDQWRAGLRTNVLANTHCTQQEKTPLADRPENVNSPRCLEAVA